MFLVTRIGLCSLVPWLQQIGLENLTWMPGIRHLCHACWDGLSSKLRGCVPQALTLLGGFSFIAWHLRHAFLVKCRRGPKAFWGMPAVSAHWPTWKRPCAALVRLVRHTTNTNVKVKLATIVEGDPKAPFSIATTPRCRGGRYSIPWIAPLYPWTVPFNAEC